jgi:hypothetical protein
MSATTAATAAADDATVLNLAQAAGQAPNLAGTEADEAELENELQEMEASASTLHKEGQLSASELQAARDQVETTRRAFRDLPPDVRSRIIRQRREYGVRLTQRQLPGVSVVDVEARINHTRLKPLFEQWWPFMNRMSINLTRFGSETFDKKAETALNKWLEDRLTRLEDMVREELAAARAFCEMKTEEMRKKDQHILQPNVARPSMVLPVEAYTRFSLRVLKVIMDFDVVLDHCDFMVWNGIRNASDLDVTINQFLREFRPLGQRSYETHLKLMTTIHGLN